MRGEKSLVNDVFWARRPLRKHRLGLKNRRFSHPGSLSGRLRVPWAAPGPLPGPSRPLQGRPWVVLGRSHEPLGPLWVALGALLGRPWASPDLSWTVLGASWASPGPPLGALGPLLEAKCDVTKPHKNHGFSLGFAGVWGSGDPPGASWGPLGGPCGLLAALGRLLGRP